jgi:hypothetical protein
LAQSGFFFCFPIGQGGQSEGMRKLGNFHQGQLYMETLIFRGFVMDIAVVGEV